MTGRISVICRIALLALITPCSALAVESGKIVRLHRINFEPPAGHRLVGVTDEVTGRALAIQKTVDGDYVCLVALDSTTAAPSLRPVFAREDQRKDFTFLFPPAARRGVEIRKSDGRLRILPDRSCMNSWAMAANMRRADSRRWTIGTASARRVSISCAPIRI